MLFMGWKARRAAFGRAKAEARSVRASPLYPKHRGQPMPLKDRGIQQTEFPYLLNIMSDVEEREGSEWKNAMRVFELGMILRRIEVYG